MITLIPVLALTIFLYQSLRIFESDKVAYVYDSSLSFSRTRALQVRSEIKNIKNILRVLVFNLREDKSDLNKNGRVYFETDGKTAKFELWKKAKGDLKFSLVSSKSKNDTPHFSPPHELSWSSGGADDTQISFETSWSKNRLYFSLASLIPEPESGSTYVARVVIIASELVQSFNESTAFSSFLVTRGGRVLLAPSDYEESQSNFKVTEASRLIANQTTASGTLEWKSFQTFLLSYAGTGVGDLTVISAVEKQAAMSAVDSLINQAAWFFLVLILVTVAISYLSANRLTQSLQNLFEATKRVSQGDFSLKVDVASQDEVGDLANSFNRMSEEVSRLLQETSLKARMEVELKTAQTVQEAFFPQNRLHIGPLEISGYYEPASECGGDWWFYREGQDTVTVFIGDVTGHGVAAALMTSVVHAVCHVAYEYGEPSPSQHLKLINEAIFHSARGKLMMTFFVGQLDLRTGLLKYSLASHEPPVLIKASELKADRKNLAFLFENNNPRLGENAKQNFTESEVQLQPGDRLFLYTDGLYDVHSPEGKELGDRQMMRLLAAALNDHESASNALDVILKHVQEWRAGTELKDDVTAVCMRYSPANSLKKAS